MVLRRRKTIFERFFENRSALIQLYNNNDITKREFLEMNFDFIRRMQLKPFTKVDSFEKGMYNYQYFNSMAKYYKMLAKELKDSRHFKKYQNDYLNKCNHYYHEKDLASLRLMQHLNFDGVVAYFIDTNSEALKGKLYEIFLENHKEAIFHSKSNWLLERLKEEGVFLEHKQKSLIADYINERY